MNVINDCCICITLCTSRGVNICTTNFHKNWKSNIIGLINYFESFWMKIYSTRWYVFSNFVTFSYSQRVGGVARLQYSWTKKLFSRGEWRIYSKIRKSIKEKWLIVNYTRFVMNHVCKKLSVWTKYFDDPINKAQKNSEKWAQIW